MKKQTYYLKFTKIIILKPYLNEDKTLQNNFKLIFTILKYI